MHKNQKKIKGLKLQRHLVDLKIVRSCLTEEQLRLNNLNQEKGSSSWLTSLPVAEEGYDLTKNSSGILFEFTMFGHSQDFQIIVNVVKNLTFNMLFLAKKIGFVSLRHNLVRNITSSLLSEVCKDVRVEQQLQLTA